MPRTIFPVRMNKTERTLLTQLSREAKLTRADVVRKLILKEVAGQALKGK